MIICFRWPTVVCVQVRALVWALDAGMTKLESSANLNISFPAVFGRRSDAVTMYANGPRPEYSCVRPHLQAYATEMKSTQLQSAPL